MESSTRAGAVIIDNGIDTPSPSSVSWSAIFAGGVATAAVSLILLILGTGLGLTAVSPWSSAGISATALGVSAVIWVVFTQWVAAGLGGYLTGRLRTKWLRIHNHESFFRDTAHGFLAWGVATLFTAALLGSAASALVSGTTTAATTVLSGAAHGAAQGTAQTSQSSSSPTAYFVDILFRPALPSADTSLPEAAAATRAESGRILAKAISDGTIEAADKSYLAQLIAAETGIEQADAEKRVDEIIARAKAGAAKVKQAADDGRKATATVALVSFLSLIIGAFIASAAAALGGHQRDESEIITV